MATYPTVATIVAGTAPTAADLNTRRDALSFFRNTPCALVYNSAIACANVADTYFTFASERYDNDGIHSTSTFTGRLTCMTAGVYTISGYAAFANDADGAQRTSKVRLNGATVLRQLSLTAMGGNPVSGTLTFDYKLAVGDYLELGVYHDAGNALNVTPEFGMTWKSVG